MLLVAKLIVDEKHRKIEIEKNSLKRLLKYRFKAEWGKGLDCEGLMLGWSENFRHQKNVNSG